MTHIFFHMFVLETFSIDKYRPSDIPNSEN
jgi:hypothetical protein